MLQGLVMEIDTMVEEATEDGEGVESNEAKSTAAFLRGKAWNALEVYQPKAEENLSKSVKLDPTNAMVCPALMCPRTFLCPISSRAALHLLCQNNR
jgi:hypothetical protein